MPSIDLLVETNLARTSRVKQLEGMFDVPAKDKLRHEWRGNVPFEDRDWNVGLVVGPSGCGKSQVVKHFFGEARNLEWGNGSVGDDFSPALSMEDIASVCSAVGFNTIPSWMKPYHVLSNGERFRVDLARRLAEDPDPIVVDEFTSVVDRQVAKIAAHAVQKHIRRGNRRFVAATCHYDVIEWLQPDWVFEPATMSFTWRELQRRPAVECEISRVPYSTWRVFAPYHYLTAELHRASRCFALFVDGVVAAFSAVLHRPHPKVRNVFGISRAVTLPDFQGLGLIFVLMDNLGAAYKARGAKFPIYPAHPSFIRSVDRNPNWLLVKRPGKFEKPTSSLNPTRKIGGRPCAVFSYCGAAMIDRWHNASSRRKSSRHDVRGLPDRADLGDADGDGDGRARDGICPGQRRHKFAPHRSGGGPQESVRQVGGARPSSVVHGGRALDARRIAGRRIQRTRKGTFPGAGFFR